MSKLLKEVTSDNADCYGNMSNITSKERCMNAYLETCFVDSVFIFFFIWLYLHSLTGCIFGVQICQLVTIMLWIENLGRIPLIWFQLISWTSSGLKKNIIVKKYYVLLQGGGGAIYCTLFIFIINLSSVFLEFITQKEFLMQFSSFSLPPAPLF